MLSHTVFLNKLYMFQEQKNSMSKKKRRLWLNKPKRVMKTRRKYSLLNNTSVHCTCNTPFSNNMRQCTPSKVRTPKRKKVTPYTPDRNTIPLGNSPQNFFTECIPEVESELVQRFLVKMRENGHYKDFIKFMKCAITGTFPLDNLSFVLFMETVRFFQASNTSEMRYSETSKLF